MTSALARHDLPALLATTGDKRVDPRLSRDFVALLAAVGASPQGTSYDAVRELLEAGQTALEWLELDLEARVRISPPEAPARLDAWLRDVELVALAHIGAERLSSEIRPDLAQSLAAEAVRLALVHADAPPRAWDCELVADASKDELPACAPWTWIASRTARGLLVPDDIDRTALSAWLEHRIHAEDAATLRRLVRESSAWGDAYREALRVEHESVHPPRLDARQTVTTAHTVEELDTAMCLMSIDLPHLGDAVTYEARLGASEIWWRWLGVDRPTTQTSDDATVHEWGDDVLGRCLVAIVPQPSSEVAIAEDVARSADALATGLVHPRTGEIALEVADDFARGRLRSALERAAATFASGADEEHDESRWTKAALSIRLSMADIAARLARADVDDAFDRADGCLRDVGDALLLLNEDEYRDWTDGSFIDPERWWGARERLLGAPSNGELQHSLSALAKREKAETPQYDNVVRRDFGAASRARESNRPREYRYAAASDGPHVLLDELAAVAPGDDAEFLRRSQAATTAISAMPCPWLDGTLREALARVTARHPEHPYLPLLRASLSPQIGVVPVVLIDTATGDGLVVALRVRVGSAGGDDRIRAIAWQAMERAYEAVSRSSPTKLPRDAWDDLSFDIDGLPAEAEVDGDSLALPFAIAIASLWQGRPPPADVVATGNVRAGDGAAIGMVEGVLAKVRAAAAAAGGTPVRVLVPAASAVVTDQPSTTLHGVSSLADALAIAGLALEHADYLPCWPDRASLVRRLREDIEHVEHQNLADFTDRGDPWRALALRLRLAADAMSADADADADDLVGRARVYASLAYQHAGDVDQAKALLRGSKRVELPLDLEPLRTLVQLGAAIDDADWAACDELSVRVDEELLRCSVKAQQALFGMVRGTQGRAQLHRRRNDDAVALLRESVDWHARHLRREVARSRIYLASALRQAGAFADALQELGTAGHELNEMRRSSRPYARSTEVFLRYERARVLVALHQFPQARDEALAALQSSQGMGFWPRLGLLRVLAWANAAVGDEDGRDDALDEMRALSIPPAHEQLRQRLVALAIAGPDADDEIY